PVPPPRPTPPPTSSATPPPPPRSEATRSTAPPPITPSASSDEATIIPGSAPNTSSTPRSTATTIPATARANSSTSRVVLRRAWAWRSKKFMGRGGSRSGSGKADGRRQACGGCARRHAHAFRPVRPPVPGRGRGSSELHLGRRSHLGAIGRDVEQRGRGEVEHAGDNAGGEYLAPVVVGHRRVVV